MGGYGSGRQDGRPIADSALWIDLAWMLRTKHAVPGSLINGNLSWTCRGEPSGNINYRCDMSAPGSEHLELNFTVETRSTGDRQDFSQHVPLSFIVPHFGGKRWWMHCPINGSRVGKLYCPRNSETFASRTAWQLGYQSQRDAARDKPFSALFRLQRKLGCDEGWERGIIRPKGMWHRTFERHWKRYWELDEQCAVEMMGVVSRLRD